MSQDPTWVIVGKDTKEKSFDINSPQWWNVTKDILLKYSYLQCGRGSLMLSCVWIEAACQSGIRRGFPEARCISPKLYRCKAKHLVVLISRQVWLRTDLFTPVSPRYLSPFLFTVFASSIIPPFLLRLFWETCSPVADDHVASWKRRLADRSVRGWCHCSTAVALCNQYLLPNYKLKHKQCVLPVLIKHLSTSHDIRW